MQFTSLPMTDLQAALKEAQPAPDQNRPIIPAEVHSVITPPAIFRPGSLIAVPRDETFGFLGSAAYANAAGQTIAMGIMKKGLWRINGTFAFETQGSVGGGGVSCSVGLQQNGANVLQLATFRVFTVLATIQNIVPFDYTFLFDQNTTIVHILPTMGVGENFASEVTGVCSRLA